MVSRRDRIDHRRTGNPARDIRSTGPGIDQGAEEWLDGQMRGSYRPTADQAALTAAFDMEMARHRSPSFDKMWRAVAALLQ